jgi:hypothetical protein
MMFALKLTSGSSLAKKKQQEKRTKMVTKIDGAPSIVWKLCLCPNSRRVRIVVLTRNIVERTIPTEISHTAFYTNQTMLDTKVTLVTTSL